MFKNWKAQILWGIFVILLVAMPFIFGFAVTAKAANYNENYFTNKLIKEYNFNRGKSIKGFRSDLEKNGYTIEVDWETKIYEAIGQSLSYSYKFGLKPGIVILDFHKKEYYNKFIPILNNYNIKYWIFKVNKKTGKIS